MKTRELLIIAFVLSVFSASAFAQGDYDFYLQKARQLLAEGDCSRAEASYNTYKDMTKKTDKDIERRIRECKEGSQSGNSAEVQLADGKYIGEMANGKPHGKGKMLYKDDDSSGRVSYEGDWVNGNQSGYGIMIWKIGDKYEGQWTDGNRIGQGTYYWGEGSKWNGDKYVGQYKDDKRHGRGTYYFESGSRYEGDWENDNRHGQGTYYWADGDKDTGTYINDKRDGKWTRIKKGGTRLTAKYSNGEIVEDWH